MSILLQAIIVVLALAGTALVLLAAVGILVLTDVYTRMQAASKAATLGAACILSAAALHFSELELTVRALTALFFLLLTIPIAAHILGRAAYLAGVPMAEESVVDELRGRYDRQTHTLGSGPPGSGQPGGAAPQENAPQGPEPRP